ncbi:MAG: Branched-chain amino acid transport system 2 carrier protein [Chlamydiae bacterium]|nr:Branched-chain amino acid transport system 2 carrier protein [Chlamydiota bacterium]
MNTTAVVDVTARKPSIWSTGLAMFAMFFGAGNIVFPIALGQYTQDKNLYGMLGMVITAVLVPLMGLLAMMLYEGNYNAFFRRIGKLPGFTVVLLILGLIGPFAGIPRCITISYSTLTAFGLEGLSWMNLGSFSVISCVVIFLFAYRPNKILTLLGLVLTPILLLSLAVIVIKGALTMPAAMSSLNTRWETFSYGLLGGYNTMDLLAAFLDPDSGRFWMAAPRSPGPLLSTLALYPARPTSRRFHQYAL